MWCGLPMTITRLGYEKVIEAFKEKLDEREEERTKLKKYHEGNDLYNTDLMACKNKKKKHFSSSTLEKSTKLRENPGTRPCFPPSRLR